MSDGHEQQVALSLQSVQLQQQKQDDDVMNRMSLMTDGIIIHSLSLFLCLLGVLSVTQQTHEGAL